MQRARTPDGRFQSAAPYQHARGADGRFTAQRALQVADDPGYVARHGENAESTVTARNSSWLKPNLSMFAALTSLPISLASDVSGTTTADGTRNAPSHSMFAAADTSLPTCGLVPGAADMIDETTTAASAIPASSRSMFAGAATRFPTCPLIPNLPIEKCGANIPGVPVERLTDLGMGCLHNPQSGDTCNICFCAMFHANPPLQDTVHALDEMFHGNSTAREVIGAQMLEDRPFIDYVTNPDPFGGVKNLPSINKRGGWHEAMVRIMETLKRHAENFNLPALVTRFIDEYPHLVMALGGLGVGVSTFAVCWFLKWLLKVLFKPFLRSRSADGGVNVGLKADVDVDLEAGVNVDLEAGVNVNHEASVEEIQEAEKEESPPDDNPRFSAGNTTITLVKKRNIGCKRLLQYRFRVENQPHWTDNWASIPFLTEMLGSEEALRVSIENLESMSPQEDSRSWSRVDTMTREHLRMFLLGKWWY